MILTWFRLWPFLGFPFIILFSLGTVPEFVLLGRQQVGGFLIREPLLDSVTFLLPADKSTLLHNLYYSGDYFLQLLIHGVLALNINAILLPLLYVIGTSMIFVSSWIATTDLTVKTKTARR